jgi:stage V sporulation protein AD
MAQRLGKQTAKLDRPIALVSCAAAVGKKEGEGPLGRGFDRVFEDSYLGQDSWEKAEVELIKSAYEDCLAKAPVGLKEPDAVLGGDLLNQCIGSSFALRGSGIPFCGLYGACSTMAQGLIMSALTVESGAAKNAACVTSSHFCSAERQYRMPVEYGGQRTPTPQWTVTGSGCCVLGYSRRAPRVAMATVGKIVDAGITDAANMGAAMAPAICIIEP